MAQKFSKHAHFRNINYDNGLSFLLIYLCIEFSSTRCRRLSFFFHIIRLLFLGILWLFCRSGVTAD